MVASFLRHLCREMVDRVKEYSVIVRLVHLLKELLREWVIEKERVLNRSESRGELDRTHVVS
jgi:hypothetical protein